MSDTQTVMQMFESIGASARYAMVSIVQQQLRKAQIDEGVQFPMPDAHLLNELKRILPVAMYERQQAELVEDKMWEDERTPD